MDFQPPETSDLMNVTALNRAFIASIPPSTEVAAGVSRLPASLTAEFGGCDAARLERLCRNPFLIFSLAENDAARWRRLFDGHGAAAPDLVDAMQITPSSPVVAAALGFLWQLSRRRPYAARVVGGASLAWCQRLADCTLVDVLQFAAAETDLLRWRMAEDTAFWQRMLVAGTSDEKSIRRAARLCSLQTLLTTYQAERFGQLPAAACSMPAPAQRVADKSVVSHSSTRGYNTPPDASAENKKPHQDVRKR